MKESGNQRNSEVRVCAEPPAVQRALDDVQEKMCRQGARLVLPRIFEHMNQPLDTAGHHEGEAHAPHQPLIFWKAQKVREQANSRTQTSPGTGSEICSAAPP